MKKLILFIPVAVLMACGGSEEDSAESGEEVREGYFDNNGPELTSCRSFQETMTAINADFNKKASDSLENVVCGPNAPLAYKADGDQLNVWLLSNYILANFDEENRGQYDYGLPETKMYNGFPLRDLWWLNYDQTCEITWGIYRDYPELKDVETDVTNGDGSKGRYTGMDDVIAANQAMENGLLGIVAITQYYPPSDTTGKMEGGAISGYVFFADWNKGSAGCMSPFEAFNDEDADVPEDIASDPEKLWGYYYEDLQTKTFDAIRQVVANRTGFTGTIAINDKAKMDSYR